MRPSDSKSFPLSRRGVLLFFLSCLLVSFDPQSSRQWCAVAQEENATEVPGDEIPDAPIVSMNETFVETAPPEVGGGDNETMTTTSPNTAPVEAAENVTTAPVVPPTGPPAESTQAPTATPICQTEWAGYRSCFTRELNDTVADECDICVGSSFPAIGSGCEIFTDEICTALTDECQCGACTDDVYVYLQCVFVELNLDCELECDLYGNSTLPIDTSAPEPDQPAEPTPAPVSFPAPSPPTAPTEGGASSAAVPTNLNVDGRGMVVAVRLLSTLAIAAAAAAVL